MAANTITQQELINKVLDLEVSDEEIAQYFVLDEERSEAFEPHVKPNPDLVQDNGLEGAFMLNTFNGLARMRRNMRYRKRIKNWTGVKVVAEGDSWFQYPLILKDTIDYLCDLDHFEYAIYGLSEAGDLLSNIVKEDEISEAIEKENPDVFLISGGGNDMVGNKRMAKLVHPFSPNLQAEQYPNEKFDQFLDELETLYRGLFTRLLAKRRHLKIICHGYDKAIPAEGRWLGKPLEKQGIDDKVLQRQIVAEMIKRFNERLVTISEDFTASVYHVDCQGLVGTKSKWHDELHPKNAGYFKVAEKFDAVIKQALEDTSPFAPVPTEMISASNPPGAIKLPSSLPQLSKLTDKDFAEIVVKRASAVLNTDFKMPKNRTERRKIEKKLRDHLEKIHLVDELLPSSFLEKGVSRAQSVCRISTGGSFGSGFLIASRNFIMTNNHVLPNARIAARSRAEFDYDEDNILYTVNLDPDRFFITDEELDFTIVACDPDPLPDDIEAIALLRDPATITRDERANIVQHPKGGTKKISIHDNKVAFVYDKVIQYTSDTEPGSSGSPVFNNEWNLVALHHAGWSEGNGRATNQGIRIKAIVDFLTSQNENESSNGLVDLLELVQDSDDSNDLESPVSSKHSKQKPAAPKGSGKLVTLNLNGEVDEITINF